MKYNPLTNAFETPIPPSTLTDEEEMALYHKNTQHLLSTDLSAGQLLMLERLKAEQNKKS